jgi:hypothetical protein
MGLPRLMFWAWERPDDLGSLDPQNEGVAYLAGTIYLRPNFSTITDSDEGVVLRPRLQPLRLPPGIPLMAVVRIEVPRAQTPQDYLPGDLSGNLSPDWPFTDGQRKRIVAMISGMTASPAARAIQIDFDATLSERTFYRALLEDLRKQVPPGMPISITALASWCIGDPWLERLPPGTINEAVPMLFRMGPDAAEIESMLSKGREFRLAVCQGSLGLSTDEPFSQEILKGRLDGAPSFWRQKRFYVFHSGSWTEKSATTTIEQVKTWHDEFSALHSFWR